MDTDPGKNIPNSSSEMSAAQLNAVLVATKISEKLLETSRSLIENLLREGTSFSEIARTQIPGAWEISQKVAQRAIALTAKEILDPSELKEAQKKNRLKGSKKVGTANSQRINWSKDMADASGKPLWSDTEIELIINLAPKNVYTEGGHKGDINIPLLTAVFNAQSGVAVCSTDSVTHLVGALREQNRIPTHAIDWEKIDPYFLPLLDTCVHERGPSTGTPDMKKIAGILNEKFFGGSDIITPSKLINRRYRLNLKQQKLHQGSSTDTSS